MTVKAILGASAWLVAGLASGAAVAASAEPWALVDEYCVSCHNTSDWAGELALDVQDRSDAHIPAEAETWEKVIRRMRGRLMPPPGEKRPGNADTNAFVQFLEGRIDAAALKHVEPGHVPLHRLNRREYTNAIRCSGSAEDRKSTRLNSSHVKISYAVFCLKKKNYNK